MTSGRRRAGILPIAAMLAAECLFPVCAMAQTTAPGTAASSASVAAPSISSASTPPGTGIPASAAGSAVAPQETNAAPSPSAEHSPSGSQTSPSLATPAGSSDQAAAPPGTPAAQSGAAASVPSTVGYLPDDLSPRGMFRHADMVVKIVIMGLILASVVTWTVWLFKTIELTMARRELRRSYRALRGAVSLTMAAEAIGASKGVARALVHEASDEWQRSIEALDDRDGLKERVALHLERIEALTGRRMMVGTGILATIGSTAPFVGLFGTVWGIMDSFIGIAKSHATNLAVVAPGIAEALLATACGLIAAIPAVVIYNHFTREIAGYKALVANAASAVMVLVSRDLSRGDTAIADAIKAEARRGPTEQRDAKTSLRLIAE